MGWLISGVIAAVAAVLAVDPVLAVDSVFAVLAVHAVLAVLDEEDVGAGAFGDAVCAIAISGAIAAAHTKPLTISRIVNKPSPSFAETSKPRAAPRSEPDLETRIQLERTAIAKWARSQGLSGLSPVSLRIAG